MLGWACPAACDLVTATILVGSLSVGPGRQVFGFLSAKVSDPQWKTWLGFSLFHSEEGNFLNKDS